MKQSFLLGEMDCFLFLQKSLFFPGSYDSTEDLMRQVIVLSKISFRQSLRGGGGREANFFTVGNWDFYNSEFPILEQCVKLFAMYCAFPFSCSALLRALRVVKYPGSFAASFWPDRCIVKVIQNWQNAWLHGCAKRYASLRHEPTRVRMMD